MSYVVAANAKKEIGLSLYPGTAENEPLPFDSNTLTLTSGEFTFNYWIEDSKSGIIIYTAMYH